MAIIKSELMPVQMNSKILELFEIFLRGLGHQIRTPLSVVINDLAYINSRFPEVECQRPLTRARDIANILSELTPQSGIKERFKLSSIKDFFESRQISSLKIADDSFETELIIPRLQQACLLCYELLEKNLKAENFSLEINQQEVLFSSNVDLDNIKFDFNENKFCTLTEVFQFLFGKEEPKAVLFDLLLLGLPLNYQVELSLGDKIKIILNLKFS
jgi:hypothetical protein